MSRIFQYSTIISCLIIILLSGAVLMLSQNTLVSVLCVVVGLIGVGLQVNILRGKDKGTVGLQDLLAAIGEKDLTVTLGDTVSDDVKLTGENALKSLNKHFSETHLRVSAAGSAIIPLINQVLELNKIAEHSASISEHVATASHEMSSSIHEIASNVSETVGKTNTVVSLADEGEQISGQSMDYANRVTSTVDSL